MTLAAFVGRSRCSPSTSCLPLTSVLSVAFSFTSSSATVFLQTWPALRGLRTHTRGLRSSRSHFLLFVILLFLFCGPPTYASPSQYLWLMHRTLYLSFLIIFTHVGIPAPVQQSSNLTLNAFSAICRVLKTIISLARRFIPFEFLCVWIVVTHTPLGKLTERLQFNVLDICKM